ncbi:MAG: pilus assembly protein [Salinibacterium sp.]|nr:pilus assembly protein [Salinibacterium sp.]
MRFPADERGSATAELAVALPSVVLVLACCISGMSVAGQQLRLTDAAALAARTLGRGGDPHAIAARLSPGALVTLGADGDIVCVTLSQSASLTALLPVTLSARSCALGGGR